MTTSIFGPMVSRGQIEKAVIAGLQEWFPTYLAEMERLTERPAGQLQGPLSYAQVGDFDEPATRGSLPAAIIVSPGTVGEPSKRGDGIYDAWFEVRIAIIVPAESKEAARDLAQLYGLAVRLMAIQQPSWGDIVSQTIWMGEADAPVKPDYLAMGWATETALHVRVEAVATAYAGPLTPDLDPGPLPVVETTNLTIEKELLP